MSYNPDVWTVVQIKNKDTGKRLYKLLAGWYGGFTGSDSWRLNSGITKIQKSPDNENVYQVYGFSGSLYSCHKNAEGTSVLTDSIFLQLKGEAEKSGFYEVTRVPMEGLNPDFEEARSFA